MKSRTSSRRQRACDLSHATWPAFDRQPEAVQFDDRRNQAQTKAGSETIAALVRAVEASRHRSPFIFSDAGSGVRNSNDAFAVAVDQGELHAPARGREFQGIVDQVGDCLEKKVGAAAPCAIISGCNLQTDMLGFR